MRKIALILLVLTLVMITGCKDGHRKNLSLPEAKNDKTYAVIGGADEPTDIKVTDGKDKNSDEVYNGDGYTIVIPKEDYRFEKDFDDGVLEEKWEYTQKDDVEIKVTTYKESDEITARTHFLRDNDDYIFEDLMGYPLCGQERDGDTLWFDLHESSGTVYIVSWEYPKNTEDDLKTELANIAETFELVAVTTVVYSEGYDFHDGVYRGEEWDFGFGQPKEKKYLTIIPQDRLEPEVHGQGYVGRFVEIPEKEYEIILLNNQEVCK